ncbi:MAG: efflux transporter periplasmic adaptor subunit, partial [Vannielia sp.]|nr:efflux transporter periplasmic adaptor subunit [Vannielia sp.]
VAERSPLIGPGIRARAIGRPQEGAEAAPPSTQEEMLELTEERRARLIAYVQGNQRMAADAKERVLAILAQARVPAATVERLESRMGG